MKREKWIIRVAVFGLLVYVGYVLFMLINDGEKYWSVLIFPILLIVGLQKHNYTGWIILMTNLIVKGLFYLFVVLKCYIYIRAQLIDASQENYLSIYHYIFAIIGLLIVTIYVWHQKKEFAGEQKKYPDTLKKICILLLALSIPFLPIIEPKLKLELDFSTVNVSNTDSWHRIKQVAFSPDNKIIATIEDRPQFFMWDLQKRNSELVSADEAVCSVALSSNGNYLVLGRAIFRQQGIFDTNDAGIEIWNRYTGEKIALKRSEPWINGPASAIQVTCSPDNIHFALARAQRPAIIEIWNLQTGTLDKTIQVDGVIDILNRRALVRDKITYNPDGKTIAVEGAIVTIWDVNTGQCTAGLTSEGNSVTGDLAYSPDGRYLASVMNKFPNNKEQGTIEIWELATQSVVANLDWDLNMPVETVQYSPDGQYIAVGGGASVGGIVKIWEAGSGALIKSMKYPDRAVRSVAFSPNGKELVVAGLTHIKVWDWQ